MQKKWKLARNAKSLKTKWGRNRKYEKTNYQLGV